MASPKSPSALKLSVHAKSYIPDADKLLFDDCVHTFTHASQFGPSGAPASNASSITLQAITPRSNAPSHATSASVADRNCIADLRDLTAQSYSSHFSTLLSAELESGTAAATYNDLRNCSLTIAKSRHDPSVPYRITAQLQLPGLLEGNPYLEVGSIVRLRPEAEQLPPPTKQAPGRPRHPFDSDLSPALTKFGACEVEALVETVVPTRGILVLRLPPRAFTRVCVLCLHTAHMALPEWVHLTQGNLPLHLADTTMSCGHQVMCRNHAAMFSSQGELPKCPLCGQVSGANPAAARPIMPVHLQGPAETVLQHGHGAQTDSFGSDGVDGSIATSNYSIDLWMRWLGSLLWRVRFEEIAARPLLLATRRVRQLFQYVLDQQKLFNAIVGPHTALDEALALLIQSVLISAKADQMQAAQAITRFAQHTMHRRVAIAKAVLTGGDSGLIEATTFKVLGLTTGLRAGLTTTAVYARAVRALAEAYTVADVVHRLFPALPTFAAFHPDLLLMEVTPRSLVDTILQATVIRKQCVPGQLQPLTLERLYHEVLRNGKYWHLGNIKQVEEALGQEPSRASARDLLVLDAAVYDGVVTSMLQAKPQDGRPMDDPAGIDILPLPNINKPLSKAMLAEQQFLAQPVLHWLDERLNAQQRACVQAVVSGAHGRVPYLLVGPAGCGKTSVLVEILAQLVTRSVFAPGHNITGAPRHLRHGRILLVAPSDEAVDLVLYAFMLRHRTTLIDGQVEGDIGATGQSGKAMRPAGDVWEQWRDESTRSVLLPKSSPSQGPLGSLQHIDGACCVLRLNSTQRPPDTFRTRQELMSTALINTEAATGAQSFEYPDARFLQSCAVVACTARVAALLPGLGLPAGSFTHILYDEASQSLEPEALSALELAGPLTRVVLAGDPRQLGPALRSPLAHEYGLSVSVQERLGLGRNDEKPAGQAAMASSHSSSSPARAGAPGSLLSTQYDAGAHMASSLFRNRVKSVYIEYRDELLSGQWLARRGLPRWPLEYRDEPADNTQVTGPLAGFGTALTAILEASTAASPVSSFDSSKSFVEVRQPLDHLLETALTVNFRSHQALCDLPSRLFYAQAPIVSEAPRERAFACLGFSLLNGGDASSGLSAGPFPMLAVGVDGDMEAGETAIQGAETIVEDESGKSYVNTKECEAVAWLIQCLLYEGGADGAGMGPPARRMLYRSSTGMIGEYSAVAGGRAAASLPLKVKPSDIAVICPFRRQVLKMRTVLRDAGLVDVNVGEPQNLQGADKPVVIICTVLAKGQGASLLEHYRHRRRGAPLGLMLNDKSFCVSITRPESLLIAVGHAPTWVAEGGNWKELLRTAVERGSFVGMGDETRCTVQVPPGLMSQPAAAEQSTSTPAAAAAGGSGPAKPNMNWRAALFPAKGLSVSTAAGGSERLDPSAASAMLPSGLLG